MNMVYRLRRKDHTSDFRERFHLGALRKKKIPDVSGLLILHHGISTGEGSADRNVWNFFPQSA